MNICKILETNKQYFEDFISRSTYHSNAIEGSTLSFDETYALLFNNKHCNVENANPKEIYEAINHKYALNIVLEELKKETKITKEYVLKLNQTINKNIMEVGGYRLNPIRVIGSDKKFPLPLELEEKMDHFLEKYNKIFEKNTDLLEVAQMHIEFENIHPYSYGNGRVGRLLMNHVLLKNNLTPIVIPVEKRKEYLGYMEKNDIENLAKFLSNLQKQELERIQDFEKMKEENE